MTSGVKREDLGIGLGFLRKWERCAVVTDAQWIHDLMRRFGWLMGRRLRQFPRGRAAGGDEVGGGGVDSPESQASTQVVLVTLAFLCTATHHAEPAVRSNARLSRGGAVRSIHTLHTLYSLHRV